MKDKTILVIITILFLVTGTLLLFSALNEYSFGGDEVCMFKDVKYVKGDEIDGYLYGSKCVCGSGGLVDCIPLFQDDNFEVLEGVDLDTSDLDTDGLDFRYSYLLGVSSSEVGSFANIEFQNISLQDNDLVVVVDQLQTCPESNVSPEQVGFYKVDRDFLNLYNMIRPVEGDLAIDCVVQLRYVIENFESFGLEMKNIRFVDEFAKATSPRICLYNDRVYSDGDVFQNTKGEICNCKGGLIDCE